MQIQSIQDKITKFLERKFRASHSLSTKNTYNSSLRRFIEFLHVQYDMNIEELLQKIETNQIDPIDTLDTFYSFLSHYKRKNSEKISSKVTVEISFY